MALIGDEEEVAAAGAALVGAGVSDLLAAPFGTETEQTQTLARLSTLR